jgi:hypothetical protein
MMTDDDPGLAKLAGIFECKICSYTTVRKNDLTKHLGTAKHKMMTDDDLGLAKLATHKCQCGKGYKYKQGLSVHKKKCQFVNNDVSDENQISVKHDNDVSYKEMLIDVINQNKILQDIIMKKENQLTEMIPKIGNNNNTINQNLNINVFLNETCKDALNMDEFIKTIEISVNNLLFTKDKGLVQGISNIFIESLNKLPLIQRPLWCSDKKRKKLYIKDGEWGEDRNNEKTKNAIKNVSVIQVKNINEYTKTKPNWMHNDKEKDNYINMVKNVTNNIEGNEEKVINNLIDTIHLTNEVQNKI